MAGDRRENPTTYGGLAPEAALGLVGNDVRAEILWALSDAREDDGPPALSFSELRERVRERREARADPREIAEGAPDADSSQFNYHLQQLVGHFVERRGEDGTADAQLVAEMAGDHGEGYALRPEGTILTRTVRSLTFAGDASIDPFPVGLECYYCGAGVEAAYANGICKLQCPDCEYLYDYNLTPPGVVADDRDAVLERVAKYNRHVRAAFADGVCPYCAGSVETTFKDPTETGYPGRDRRVAVIHRACTHCGNMDNLTAGEAVLGDPELAAFCHGHGVDVGETPIWELEFAATDRHTTVRSRDPWVVAVEVSFGDDGLELVVDESLDVVERTRT
ncbi:MAG: ArsR family transcriptional regulator [Halobacterium sp.]